MHDYKNFINILTEEVNNELLNHKINWWKVEVNNIVDKAIIKTLIRIAKEE